ncbi:MAG: hypothetical protein Q8P01_06050 [bacterium]|nr:hypothetical protein [bacterium]
MEEIKIEEEIQQPKRKMSRILGVIVIVLVILLVGVFAWRWFQGRNTYYAVFLRTGDLYFGKLTRFPSYNLKNVYFIQANPEGSANPLSIQKFSNVFWRPEDKLSIPKDAIAWIAKIDKTSELAELLRTNPNLLGTGGLPQGGKPEALPEGVIE